MSKPKLTIKAICNQYKLTRAELSRQFNIPYRTLQDWYSGRRNPPDYVVHMIDALLQHEQEEQQRK